MLYLKFVHGPFDMLYLKFVHGPFMPFLSVHY